MRAAALFVPFILGACSFEAEAETLATSCVVETQTLRDQRDALVADKLRELEYQTTAAMSEESLNGRNEFADDTNPKAKLTDAIAQLQSALDNVPLEEMERHYPFMEKFEAMQNRIAIAEKHCRDAQSASSGE